MSANAPQVESTTVPLPPLTPEQVHAAKIAEFVPWLMAPGVLPSPFARLEVKRLNSGWLRLYVALQQPADLLLAHPIVQVALEQNCTCNLFSKAGKFQSLQICDNLEP